MPVIPPNISVRDNSIAIVDWQEGGGGQVHAWIEHGGAYHVACFVHVEDTPPMIDPTVARKGRHAKRFDVPTTTSFKEVPLLSAADWPDALWRIGIRKALVMLPERRQRLHHIGLALARGLELINAIHPSALILEDAILHRNIVLHARAVIGYRAELHDGTIVNIGTQLDHHNVVGPCATIDPGVVTAGNVTIGTCAQIHTGAIVKNRIRIGEDAVVGAGAVVIRDVEPATTVVGVPARLLCRNEKGKPA